MKLEEFYFKDYYNLRQVSEKEKLVYEIESIDELTTLISPYIKKIIDEFYNTLLKKENNEILLDGVGTLDLVMNNKLSHLKEYKEVEEESIRKNLIKISLTKFIEKLFNKNGGNHNEYIIQDNIISWFEYRLASDITKDSRFADYQTIISLLEVTESLHFFYSYFVKMMPDRWINTDLENWTETNISKISDVISFSGSYAKQLENYVDNLKKYIEFTPYKYVIKTTDFSDYIIYNDEYFSKNDILYKKNIKEWLKFWDNLKYPLLQDIALRYKTPFEIIEIIELICEYKSTLCSNTAHLTCLLIKNFFESSLLITEKLDFYNDEEMVNSIHNGLYDEQLIKKGKELREKWKNDKIDLYKRIFLLSQRLITEKDIEEWVFSYNYRTHSINKFTDRYNYELDLLSSTFYDVLNINDLVSEKIDFRRFVFYSQLVTKENNILNSERLLKEFFDFVRSDAFYWDGTFSRPYWESFKTIGFLLSTSKNIFIAAKNILDKVQIYHEGWNIKTNQYELINKEVFILCGILMVFEHLSVFSSKKQIEKYFKYFLDYNLNQYRFSCINKSKYLIPINLMNLIVNQIYIEQKNYFEKCIISEIDEIDELLKIISKNEGISQKNKIILKKRIDKEIPIYRKKIERQKNKQELQIINNILTKLSM